ncbi:integral membrane protein [Seiridium cupressi]
MSTTENRGPAVAGVAWTFFILAFATVVLRFYVRLGVIRAFGTDDWFMLLAMISFTLHTSFCLAGVAHGTGRHASDLAPADISVALRDWWFCYLWYCTTMIFSKTSIAFFLFRLTPLKPQRMTIYAALGISIFISTGFFFIAMFQCWPVSFFWTRVPGTGSCIPIDIIISVTYVYSAFAIITDFTFTILPIWLVKDLQLDKRTKFALIPILSLAALASCAVAVRLAYVQKFHDPDFLWATTDIAIWSQIEQGLATTAGSLPALQPLFRKALHRLGFTSSGSRAPSALPGMDSKSWNSKNKQSSRGTKTTIRGLSSSNFTRMDDGDSTVELNSFDHHEQPDSSHSKSEEMI